MHQRSHSRIWSQRSSPVRGREVFLPLPCPGEKMGGHDAVTLLACQPRPQLGTKGLFFCFLAQRHLREIAFSPTSRPLQQTRPGERSAGAGLPEGQLQMGPGPSGPPPGSTSCWVPDVRLQESAPRPGRHLRAGGPQHTGEQAELKIPIKREAAPPAVCSCFLSVLFFFLVHLIKVLLSLEQVRGHQLPLQSADYDHSRPFRVPGIPTAS